MDTSSVMSDESVLTQWSVSTQRSMLSVGDFPLIKDVNSPSRCRQCFLFWIFRGPRRAFRDLLSTPWLQHMCSWRPLAAVTVFPIFVVVI